MVRYRIRYTGRVQGVGFRMTAVAQAQGLAIHGFVRNEPDGSVLVDAEGSARDLRELRRRIEAAMSENILDVVVDSRPPSGGGNGFRIEH